MMQPTKGIKGVYCGGQHILKVAYHEEVCALCGEVINGDHFRGRCGFSRRLMKDSIRIDLENIKWF